MKAVKSKVTVVQLFTIILTVLVALQLLPSVPVTVYVLVPVVTTNGVASVGVFVPSLHAYDVAPPPVKVKLLPLHKVVDEADAVTVGNAFTVTDAVEVSVQPAPDVAVTVYVPTLESVLELIVGF